MENWMPAWDSCRNEAGSGRPITRIPRVWPTVFPIRLFRRCGSGEWSVAQPPLRASTRQELTHFVCFGFWWHEINVWDRRFYWKEAFAGAEKEPSTLSYAKPWSRRGKDSDIFNSGRGRNPPSSLAAFHSGFRPEIRSADGKR